MARVCPVCLKLGDDGADRCVCGYTYDTGEEVAGSHTVQVVQQASAENEYKSFYETRLQQAQADLRSLIARYGKSGWTPAQRQEIEQVIERVDKAREEWKAQQERTDDAEKQLEAAKTRVEMRRLNALGNKKI